MKSNELNKNNAWYEIGKVYASVYDYNDLDVFFKRNNLYSTINASANSGFKKGTFQKLLLELIKKDVDVTGLAEMYSNYTETINGMDRYFFFWGYDVAKLEMQKEMTFAEATERWGLADSTLRKLVTTDKLQEGIDYRKSGKVWLITKKAMKKVYGEPKTE